MLGPVRYLLRARRALLTYLWTTTYNLISDSPTPKKHIKIDDEERQLSQDSQFHRPRSPLIHPLKMLLLTLLSLLIILLLLAYTIYKPPNFLISYLQTKYPSVIFQLPSLQTGSSSP